MGICFAQNKKVPKIVTDTFAKKFPEAKNVKWEFEDDESVWEADFKLKKIKYSSDFDESGNWLETEREIKETDIPDKVNKALQLYRKENLPKSMIKEAERVETSKGVFYEFELVKNNIKKSLTFSEDGLILKENLEEEDEYDDEK